MEQGAESRAIRSGRRGPRVCATFGRHARHRTPPRGQGLLVRAPDGEPIGIAPNAPGSGGSRSRRRGPTSGSARPPTATSRRPGATPAGASSTATTREWREMRDDAKFAACSRSARSCREIARRGRARPACRGLPPRQVLATVVRLLDTTLIRVGNDEYAARQPHLRPDHAARPARRGRRARDCASASAARAARSTASRITDRRLARIVRAVPGPAGPGAVPVRRRGRQAADGLLRRRQRLPARDRRRASSRPRTSAPGPATVLAAQGAAAVRARVDSQARPSATSSGRSSGGGASSATPRRSAASTTSTPR